jgi:5-methylcytosine-specific restriction enzyme A
MGKKGKEEARCELCNREVSFVTKHHLLPRQEGGKYSETADLCQPCHTTIHLNFTNQELARNFKSISALQQAEALQKYLHWIRNKNIDVLKNRRSKRH